MSLLLSLIVVALIAVSLFKFSRARKKRMLKAGHEEREGKFSGITLDLIAYYFIASNGQAFAAEHLLAVLQRLGLTADPEGIFHYHDQYGQRIFTVTSATEPGYFQLQNNRGIYYSGLCIVLNMELDDLLYGYNVMWQMISYFQTQLGGTLISLKRRPLTDEEIEMERMALLEYSGERSSFAGGAT